ncbi:SDR family oxidoreductase [Niallia circulans]|uniref:SDR family oxidoreductase n=1 Tax=Niallia circulans TaxID=1397 RepID=A0A941GEY2_NIACI|nr:SDR family oxidoreductase [Niallia circulans]MCB5238635.1 SDR family oxidoreductase [Niallia circulans]
MKTWFITGANGGLAYPMIKILLERGDRVAATVRKPQALDELQKKYGSNLWIATLDLTEPNSIKQVVDQAIEVLGTIDILVNNAGYGMYGAVEEASDEQIEHLFQTNFFGSLRVARAFMPYFRAKGKGHIVQIASMVGQTSNPGLGLYSASKWAVEGAFEALAKEAAPFNIKLTMIEPGGIRTGFFSDNGVMEQELEAYRDQPAREFIRYYSSKEGMDTLLGDPEKMAKVIIQRVDEGNGPLRLALGSDAYEEIKAALTLRLADLEKQKELSFSTDVDKSLND